MNEALSATHDQIDREYHVWKIPTSVSKSKRVRSVPLTEAAMDVFDRLETTEGYLFVSPRTKQKIGHVHKVWDRLRQAAGLPKLRIHDLRHSFASMLVNAGQSLCSVQILLGHASNNTTLRYTNLSSLSLMNAANSASLAIMAAMPAKAEPERSSEAQPAYLVPEDLVPIEIVAVDPGPTVSVRGGEVPGVASM